MAQYDYHKIADLFISLSNAKRALITNIKLQKLMYYAQAWHLASKGERLFDGDFEAWLQGPVLVCLYEDYKYFRWNPITRKGLGEESYQNLRKEIDSDSLEVLDYVIHRYFDMDAYGLEALVLSEEPWLKARNNEDTDESTRDLIKDQWMAEFYGNAAKQ